MSLDLHTLDLERDGIRSRRVHWNLSTAALYEEAVRRQEAAIAAGGIDNGPPGLRPHYHENYYGAFILDPDGHNIEAVNHLPE